MARKKYEVVGGTVTTKVIDLSPKPAKTEPKRKKDDTKTEVKTDAHAEDAKPSTDEAEATPGAETPDEVKVDAPAADSEG